MEVNFLQATNFGSSNLIERQLFTMFAVIFQFLIGFLECTCKKILIILARGQIYKSCPSHKVGRAGETLQMLRQPQPGKLTMSAMSKMKGTK